MAAEVISEQPMFGLRREEAEYWMGRLREHGAEGDVEGWLRGFGNSTEARRGCYALRPVIPVDDLLAVAEPGELKFYWDKWHFKPLKQSYGRKNRKLPIFNTPGQPLKTWAVTYYKSELVEWEVPYTEEEEAETPWDALRAACGLTHKRQEWVDLYFTETFRAKDRQTLNTQLRKKWGNYYEFEYHKAIAEEAQA